MLSELLRKKGNEFFELGDSSKSRKFLPKGYQLGSVLQKLEQNLLPYEVDYLSPNSYVFSPVDGLVVTVKEAVRPLFLGHISTAQFMTTGMLSSGALRIEGDDEVKRSKEGVCLSEYSQFFECNFQAKGWVKYSGIRMLCKGNQQIKLSLCALIDLHPEFKVELSKLDFTKATLLIRGLKWQYTVQHYAASEVVGRMPPVRRYVQLTPQQRQYLLNNLLMMQQLMGALNSKLSIK